MKNTDSHSKQKLVIHFDKIQYVKGKRGESSDKGIQ